MHANVSVKNAFLYGYDASTKQSENLADVKFLFSLASKSRPTKKLLLIGGLHGLDPTGEPSGQEPTEKVPKGDAYNAGLIAQGLPPQEVVEVGGKKVCGFALADVAMKRDSGVNFTYINLAKYVTAGADMTAIKQAEVVKLIQDYHNSQNWYILMSWCFSRVWATTNDL